MTATRLPVDLFFEFSLLGLLTSGYLAVAGSGYLDAPTAALTAAGLALRAMIVLGWLRLNVSSRMVNALTIGYVGFYPIDYAFISHDFLTATVHLVFFLAVVKILTATTERDYFYVKIIAFLELLAASILSSNANFFLFLALFLMFGVATFSASEIRRAAGRSDSIVRTGQRNFGFRLTTLTAFTVLGILVMTGGLFFLLPRTARAALQRFVPERYHIPGFSNEVALGQIGELQMRSTAVMHIRMIQETQPMSLKWRGAALTNFDGKRWYNKVNTAEVLRVEPGGLVRFATWQQQLTPGKRIGYEVAMQESASDALFFAGIPESLLINVPLVIRTPSNSYRLGYGPQDRLRYAAYSVLETDGDPRYNGDPLAPDVRAANLQLPNLDARIGGLAREVTGSTIAEGQRARLMESYLRRTYPYTIELPKEPAADPVADFLFRRKKGHCEYFASSMVVMLRTIGIPARVVTGFQSGIYNPLSGWYLIRTSDAHSWVEAWIAGKGWTTFDPTPPNLNPTVSLATKLQLYFDAAQVFWQDWVLSYDIDRQLNLVGKMEQSSHTLMIKWFDGRLEEYGRKFREGVQVARDNAWKLGAIIVGTCALLVLLPLAWRQLSQLVHVRRVQRGRVSASDATLLYGRMLRRMRRFGMEKPAGATPREFAAMVSDRRLAELVMEFTGAYNELRFGGRQQSAARMVAILENLEKV